VPLYSERLPALARLSDHTRNANSSGLALATSERRTPNAKRNAIPCFANYP
jgi:hypothetical protein